MKSFSLKSLAILLIASFSVVACSKKKDDVAPPVDPIVGIWEGAYGSDGQEPDQYYSFRIKPNGLMEVLTPNKEVIANGTWKLEGGVFTAIYNYIGDPFSFNVAAKYDADAETLTGSWGEGQESADAGDFFMEKKLSS